MTCLTQYLASPVGKWDPIPAQLPDGNMMCEKVSKWGTCLRDALPIFLWVVFRWFMSVPFTGSRWCGAKSIHRSFASHPAAGALCLVPGAHAPVGVRDGLGWGAVSRQEWMWSAAVPLSTSAVQSLLCLQVRYNASVQGNTPLPPRGGTAA